MDQTEGSEQGNTDTLTSITPEGGGIDEICMGGEISDLRKIGFAPLGWVTFPGIGACIRTLS